jgi:hypothetical protein
LDNKLFIYLGDHPRTRNFNSIVLCVVYDNTGALPPLARDRTRHRGSGMAMGIPYTIATPSLN